jgi:cell division protein FtsL
VRVFRRLILLLLAVLVFASSLGAVWTSYRHRVLFARAMRDESRIEVLDARWSQLLLEQGALENHSRLARLARSRLGMGPPRRIHIVVVRTP